MHARPATTSPFPGGLDDLRLQAYRAAVRAMREGRLGVDIPPAPPASPMAALGEELAALARWLQHQFAAAERLQEISEQVAKGVLLDDVLERVYAAFKPLLPFNRLGCALLDAERSTLTARWAKTEYDTPAITRGYSAPLAGSSLARVLATGEPRIINDLEAYEREHPGSASTRAALSEGIRSSLTCPLVADGRPLGFLFFSSFEKHTFAAVHQQLYLRVAAQIALLVEKSDLYERVLELNRQLLAAQAQLRHQADSDALTGLLNRRGILAAAEQEGYRARRARTTVGVLLFDVDHFKRVNDAHGHAAGDEALKGVAAVLRRSVRPYDAVSRFGGEEFLVLVPDVEAEAAVEIAERARQALAASAISHAGIEFRVTASCGVALWRGGSGETIDQAIARADAALYEAKRAGRDRVHRDAGA